MTTTRLSIFLMLPAIGMYVLMSHRIIPATIKVITMYMSGIAPAHCKRRTSHSWCSSLQHILQRFEDRAGATFAPEDASIQLYKEQIIPSSEVP
jgi:hypothetical protein